jgi:hypothetical protein
MIKVDQQKTVIYDQNYEMLVVIEGVLYVPLGKMVIDNHTWTEWKIKDEFDDNGLIVRTIHLQ